MLKALMSCSGNDLKITVFIGRLHWCRKKQICKHNYSMCKNVINAQKMVMEDKEEINYLRKGSKSDA